MSSMVVEKDDNETEDFSKGPLSILMNSVTKNTQILISLRNNHKLLARVKAFDRHCNMVLENVKELYREEGTAKSSESLAFWEEAKDAAPTE